MLPYDAVRVHCDDVMGGVSRTTIEHRPQPSNDNGYSLSPDKLSGNTNQWQRPTDRPHEADSVSCDTLTASINSHRAAVVPAQTGLLKDTEAKLVVSEV